MKIKEAARTCGVTEKAIRLYEEKGLIHPKHTEQNGRIYRDYDEETLRELQTVAGLRQSFFSMEQIAAMQREPGSIPDIFDAYRKELREQYDRLTALIARADALDGSTFPDAGTLSAALTGNTALLSSAARSSLGEQGQNEPSSVEDAYAPYYTEEARHLPPPPPALHFRVWDEEMNTDARERAYVRARQYVEKWGTSYEMALTWGVIWKKIRKPLFLTLAAALLLFVLCGIPFVKHVVWTRPVYRVVLDENEAGIYGIREITDTEVIIAGWEKARLLSGKARFDGRLTVTEREGAILPAGMEPEKPDGKTYTSLFIGTDAPFYVFPGTASETDGGKQVLAVNIISWDTRKRILKKGIFCLHPRISNNDYRGEVWLVCGPKTKEEAEALVWSEIISTLQTAR